MPTNESYADDFHAAAHDVVPETIAERLSAAAEEISSLASAHRMPLLPSKSTVTLFTPWNRQYGRLPEVKVGDAVIPQANNPKLLGVTFDPFFTFCAHAEITARKASRRLNVIRALADTNFGHDKECLVATFKGIIRPFFDYAAPLVYPVYSPASFRRLQLVQNKALRLVMGAHAAASQTHIHDETQTLPVQQHLRLLASQHLAKALQPSNPSHSWVSRPAPASRRNRIGTLRSSCWETVAPFTTNDAVPPGELKEVLRKIHTKVVSESLVNAETNRVLGARPPPVSPSESLLARSTRAALSQLRSGHCIRLKDYQARIGKSDTAICPE